MSAPDFVVGTAANVAAPGIIAIIKKIYCHVRYVFIYKKNVEKFEEKMKLLIAKREGVQEMVAAAEKNQEKILPDVQLWCESVDNTIDEEMKKVENLEYQVKAKCFIGLCSRYQLGRKAEEYVGVVGELLRDGGFGRIAVPDVPEALICEAPKNLTAFDSRKVVFDQIVEALKDPNISMIGVYGIGGVGKTTLVNEVARHVNEIGLFCPVVVVTVTLTPDIKNIQETIAGVLGLKLQEHGESVREHKLRERLEKEEKILIVLDDIWGGSEVKQVGIPFGDQYKGCKILLTSRHRHVLTDEMDVKTPIAMDVLEENEAWNLFKKMVEKNDFENSLQSVATDIVKRCAGLPLAIVTVARALRNKELAEWRDALLQLQRPSPENFEGITKAVYSAIQLSYDNLRKQLKDTFLLSCLLGRDAHIEDLLRYAMGLRLFGGVKTVAETRNRVLTMVSKLKSSCLLLDGYDDRLDMHDLVWDSALAIASKDIHAFALRHGDVFEEWPEEGEMQKFKMICLNFASIKNLPHELDCPQLTLFSMASRGWDSYVEMPPSFFEKTKDIEVIDLMGMDFSSSSSSVSFPTSLRTLCLKRCRLGDMGSLGKLTNLEILNLSESDIEVLPEQIGQLKKLRSLDLTDCRKLEKIPPGVLSSLSKLEELYMGGVTVGWNREDNARLDELKELSEKLERYVILIGVEPVGWHMWKRFEYSRVLAVKLNSTVDHLDDGIKGLMKKTKALNLVGEGSTSVPQQALPLFGKLIELPLLEDLLLSKIKVAGRIWHNKFSTLENLTNLGIIECNNLKNILSSSMVKSLARLKRFEIWGCKCLEEIIFDEDVEEDENVTISFPSLKRLVIHRCPKLKGFIHTSTIEIELPLLEELRLYQIKVVGRIWHNQLSTLEKLTNLKIRDCDNLKDILSSSTAKSLAQLESFEVERCERLRGIIFNEDVEEDDNVTISFPSLKKLLIRCCPKLKGFIYKSTIEDSIPLSMQALFDEKIELPLLEELRLYQIKVVGRIWHNQLSTLEKLTNLKIRDCDNLKDILSSSTAKSLAQLESFEVERCERLRGIIFNEDVEEDDNVTISFPSLKKLLIRCCPKLKGFIYKSTIEDSIPLSMQVLFDEKVTFPQLEELET